MAFKFEGLTVWQRAIELTEEIHTLVRSFPESERYVLAPQTQRAADSIALNIAEGSTGQTNAELKQFLSYALRSALELVACLYLSRQRKLVKEDRFQTLYRETEGLVKMLQAFRKSLS